MRRECRVCLQEGQEGCDSDAECCEGSTCCGEGKINFRGDRFPKGSCIKATESCCVKKVTSTHTHQSSKLYKLMFTRYYTK